MIPFELLFTSLWRWIAGPGVNIAILIVLTMLVPRAGRFANRVLEARVARQSDEQEGKGKLALAGVGVYIAQLIAYFVLLVLLLQQLGFSFAGAAIPATVVSAAIGFGAQSIIADFLAGFFIISEKQYGVGDWVAFEGNGVSVEGTVIQVTMRSTQIRTIDQSTVNIPNSTARICINRSHYWSRAVVVIPVPLLGSANAEETLHRTEQATRRALRRHDVRSEIIGDLEVHPAVGVNPPSTVGMPWTVDMRLMIQVKAGSQWLVERAIRMSILNEFWNEYGSATTVSGELIDDVRTPALPLVDPTPTQEFEPVTGETTIIESENTPANDSTQPGVPELFDEGDGEDPAARDASSDFSSEDEEDDAPLPMTKLQSILTAGGRMRASSAALIVLFFVLLLLRGMSASGTVDDEYFSGVLAPPSTFTSQSETPEPELTPTPTSEPESTPIPTTYPEEPATPTEYPSTEPTTAAPTSNYAPQNAPQPSPQPSPQVQPTEAVDVPPETEFPPQTDSETATAQ
ncbi:mechanosensitive ion channel [Corynebacterium breve]|uniref:Mechanosensitive ion channel n=1 Tax=Corynebacterium breve TaxID=3049799 RepID=A0ABY8VJ79_9CORY|nr:mechanosensitive ion channel domain-containing protein [Corynebacterium breve]WIM68678.1 mechanosensitive ion channel [Corynebacterium breve]